MFRRKKVLPMLIIAIMILSTVLAGCSTTKTEDASTKTDEPVEITYSVYKDPTPATQNMIAAFEAKYPNIKVNLQELPNSSDQVHNAYVTALSAGDDSIDVVLVDVVWPAEFAAAGWLLPLEDKFTEDMRSEFLPGPVESVTYDGHLYAVPRHTDAGVLYYRKDIINNPPKTWDKLIQMSKDNVGKEGTKHGIVFQGNQYEGLVCDAMEFIGGNGGSVLNGKEVTINTPNAVGGLQYMLDLVNQGIAPAGVTTYKEEDARIIFQQGDSIFMRNWPYAWSKLNADDSPVKGKVGITAIPAGKDGEAGTPTLGGWNLAISSYSKHPEEAWKFVEFMTGPEAQKINALDGGKLPTRKTLYEDKEVLAKNPFWADLYEGFLTAKPRPVSPFYPKMSDSMQINFHKALSGEISAEDAIKNVDKELKDIIKENAQ